MSITQAVPRFTVLDRYLVRSILESVALVVLVLLALGAVFLFMNQQDDIGVGNYSAWDAMVFVLLNLPAQAWELLPISALIGSLLALGNLARDSELTVMRASGLSVWRLARAAGIAAVLLWMTAALLGEVVGPPLQDLARQQKAFSKFSNVSFTGASGAWIRDGNLILNVERQTGDTRFGGMMLYEFGPDRRLAALGRAATASENTAGQWRLDSYVETRFSGDRVVASRLPSRALESNVSAGFLGIAARSPTQLPIADLVRMVDHLEANELDARAPTFALWSRIARLFAVAFGVLLALPFVFGSLRAAGAGTRVALGLVVGIGLFILQRTLESGVVVFDAPPVLLAWIPTALMATLAIVLIARTR